MRGLVYILRVCVLYLSSMSYFPVSLAVQFMYTLAHIMVKAMDESMRCLNYILNPLLLLILFLRSNGLNVVELYFCFFPLNHTSLMFCSSIITRLPLSLS